MNKDKELEDGEINTLMDDKLIKAEIVKYAKLIYDKGFVCATDGNISYKISTDHILLTPSGIRKSELTESDIVTINMKGEKTAGKHDASSELRLHLKVYQLRPDIKTVIHAHPPVCTALTIAGISLEKPVLPEVVLSLGEIPTAIYATPTTDEVAQSIKDYIISHDALMLERHGSLTVGFTLEAAYQKLEKMEYCAKVIMAAHQMGNISYLSEDDLKKLQVLRKKYELSANAKTSDF